MTGPETFMPEEESFDHLVGEFSQEIDLALEETILQNPFGEPFSSGAYDHRVSRLANSIAVVSGARNREEMAVIAKGVLLAREIVMIIYGNSAELASISTVVDDSSSPEDIQQLLAREADRYLLNSPNIEVFLMKYIREFDSSGADFEGIKRACSLVFLLAERAYAETYQREWFHDVTPGDF